MLKTCFHFMIVIWHCMVQKSNSSYDAQKLPLLGCCGQTSRNGGSRWQSDLKHLSWCTLSPVFSTAVCRKPPLGLPDGILDPAVIHTVRTQHLKGGKKGRSVVPNWPAVLLTSVWPGWGRFVDLSWPALVLISVWPWICHYVAASVLLSIKLQ